MPLARATGIGSTFDCADHSYSVCLRARSTISLPVMEDVAAIVVMSILFGNLCDPHPVKLTSLLKLAAVLFGPAFHDNFLVGIELDGVAALPVEIAEEAVLPSTEREVSHRRGDSNVDADISRWCFIAEATRGRTARREQRGLIAVGTALQESERFVHVAGVDEAEHRTEDFGVGQLAGLRYVVKDSWVDEVSGFVLRDFGLASIEQNLCSLLLANADQRFDSLFALRRDHWSHLHASVEPVADFEFRSRIGDRVAECLLRFADRDRDRDRKAALSRTPKGTVADDLRSHWHVGVGENDDVILGSALTLRAFAIRCCACVNVFRHRRRADEADGANLRVVEERIDSSFSSVDQIHYPFGQSSLFEQFVDVVHGERDALGRLDDERVSGSDGVRQIPERDHAGKVEGHNGGDDAERLADHHLVDAAGNIFEVVALHHHRDAAGYFDVLDGAAHLSFGFGERLAVFLGEDAADFIEMIFE